jgi:hypothetical protein
LRRRTGGRAKAVFCGVLLLLSSGWALRWRAVRKDCQAKRLARERIPARRGARKMAEVQGAVAPEAFWKGKTRRTAEEMRRNAPTKSTSFQARRSSEGRYFLFGQARRNPMRETPPMGPLPRC